MGSNTRRFDPEMLSETALFELRADGDIRRVLTKFPIDLRFSISFGFSALI